MADRKAGWVRGLDGEEMGETEAMGEGGREEGNNSWQKDHPIKAFAAS